MIESENPYQSPKPVPDLAEPARELATLRKLQQEIRALGAFWIIGAAVCIFASGRAIYLQQAMQNQVIPGVLGLVFLVVGVPTLFKQKWALYCGLVLCVPAVVLSIININACGLIIPGLVGLQTVRVTRYARQLQKSGIDLHASLN
jgi:hypothetical protein